MSKKKYVNVFLPLVMPSALAGGISIFIPKDVVAPILCLKKEDKHNPEGELKLLHSQE